MKIYMGLLSHMNYLSGKFFQSTDMGSFFVLHAILTKKPHGTILRDIPTSPNEDQNWSVYREWSLNNKSVYRELSEQFHQDG